MLSLNDCTYSGNSFDVSVQQQLKQYLLQIHESLLKIYKWRNGEILNWRNAAEETPGSLTRSEFSELLNDVFLTQINTHATIVCMSSIYLYIHIL